jgi:hypothetical protein
MNLKEVKYLRTGSSDWLPEPNKRLRYFKKGREILDWVRDTEKGLCFTELARSNIS